MAKNKKTSVTTEDGFRVFKCKSCGIEKREIVDLWRRKPTRVKNVCMDCLKRKSIREETREEKLRNISYYRTFY